jgi:hypothetical protein
MSVGVLNIRKIEKNKSLAEALSGKPKVRVYRVSCAKATDGRGEPVDDSDGGSEFYSMWLF